MKRPLLYTTLTALLLAILWVLAHWVPGDRAAFFGALALYVLPILSLVPDLEDHFTGEYGSVESLSAQELDARIQADMKRQGTLRLRALINRTFFWSTLAAGVWLGIHARQPLWMAGCFVLILMATGGAIGKSVRSRLFSLTRVAGTLSAAVAIGMALRPLLH